MRMMPVSRDRRFPVHRLFAIMKREFRAAAANKTFVIMTVLGPFLILAITVLPTFLSRTPGLMSSGKPLAVVASDPAIVSALAPALSTQSVSVVSVDDLKAAKESVLSGDFLGCVEVLDGWPDNGARYFSRSGTDAMVFGTVQAVLASMATELRIRESGLPQDRAARLLSKPDFQVVKLGAGSSEETTNEEDFLGVLFTVLGFVMLIYMTVMLYGQLIGRSVVQEKTNKTVEIMLSSVSSRDLLFGKILGLGLAGLLQYAVWIGMGAALVTLIGPALQVSLPEPVTVGNFIWLVFFFLLAYFLYAAGYAAIGAAAEDEHHLGQLAWPLLIFLIMPMVLISPMVMSPGSPFVTALSFFPMTSPIVMLARILVSKPAAWEIALSVGLIVATIYGMASMAAKIFRVGILMSGKRPGFREIFRWIRVR
ncbi:MAG: ABC transporter permease [Spirochaetales bacterium]|nr:MAG: ABC transporter permease [Spirochaetales bacterium]